MRKPFLVSGYGFKIKGILLSIPVKDREKMLIPLNQYVISKLSEEGIEPRSFTITPDSISICVRKNIQETYHKM